jgi:hypothetical protein
MRLRLLDRCPGVRALAWSGNVLYASRGYQVLRGTFRDGHVRWEEVAQWKPPLWRYFTCRFWLASRLVRDGFHALAVLNDGHLVGAVPGAIVSLTPGAREFKTTHRVTRGTRPLHIAATPDGQVYWGEYFDNPQRDEVHIFASHDQGATWQIAYTFPKGAIRHVHNLVYDPWENCLWIFTGDYGAECRVLRASCDLQTVDVAFSGNQQARAVAAVPTTEALYFASDTPLESNHVYRFDRAGNLSTVGDLDSSSIYGCRVGDTLFFSTMVEPSEINPTQRVQLYASRRGEPWQSILTWQKDSWPKRFFQYGNAVLPDGANSTQYLPVTTIAVEDDDLVTSVFEVVSVES